MAIPIYLSPNLSPIKMSLLAAVQTAAFCHLIANARALTPLQSPDKPRTAI
jgi:hypothetical protein